MTDSDSDTADDTTDDTMTRVSVRLPDPMLAAVDQLVEAGEYPTRSECVRTGIRREFRDAGIERGNRRPGQSGDRLISDGGRPPEQGSPATDGESVHPHWLFRAELAHERLSGGEER